MDQIWAAAILALFLAFFPCFVFFRANAPHLGTCLTALLGCTDEQVLQKHFVLLYCFKEVFLGIHVLWFLNQTGLQMAEIE